MLDILSFLPHKRKQTNSGWISFNAVCCTHNGESQDKRGRGGVILSNTDDWSYHCFNCNFKTRFQLGKPVSVNTRKLLGWLGVSTVEIDWLSLESLRHRGLGDLASERNEESKIISANITFNKVQLPNGSRNIRSTDCRFVDYLAGRGLKYNQYNFMITPNGKFRNKNRIIIPYTHGGVIVGYTSRFLDNNLPKYLNEQQPGYIFGLDLQKSNWKYVIVVEGVLDAISINGMAVLHNKISDKQAKQLMRLAQEKEVIVVPDHDKAGKKLVDDAVKYGFSVSTPLWGNDIKDVNDAVLVNGKIATILDIITHRNNGVKSKLAIKLKLRKKFERI